MLPFFAWNVLFSAMLASWGLLSIADAGDPLASMRFELVKKGQTGVFPPAAMIEDSVARTRMICSWKCFASPLECWGFEYNSETRRCRTVTASTPTGYAAFSYSSSPGTNVYWSTPPLNLCTKGPSGYGDFAVSTWDGVTRMFGGTVKLSCAKGSAFNAQAMVDKGFLGAAPTIAQRFGSLDLSCGRFGWWYPLPSDMPPCQDFVECLRTANGREYIGTKNRTYSGKTCINWSDQTWNTSPTNWINKNEAFPTGTVADQKNYCRNPSTEVNSGDKPWCFITTDANAAVIWEYCDIPACQDPTTSTLDCKFDALGFSYLGTKATSAGGACISWTLAVNAVGLIPYYVEVVRDPALGTAIAPTHSYCRNPARDQPQPFCFVLGALLVPTRSLCTVDFCPGYP